MGFHTTFRVYFASYRRAFVDISMPSGDTALLYKPDILSMIYRNTDTTRVDWTTLVRPSCCAARFKILVGLFRLGAYKRSDDGCMQRRLSFVYTRGPYAGMHVRPYPCAPPLQKATRLAMFTRHRPLQIYRMLCTGLQSWSLDLPSIRFASAVMLLLAG